VFVWGCAGCVAHAEEACCYWVDGRCVELVEVAFVVDEDGSLEGFFGKGVVADTIVSKVVEDFESEKEAWGWGVGVPGEDGAIDDFDMFGVSSGGCGFCEVLLLERGEGGGDLNYFEFRAGVDFRVGVADVIEDVEHQCAVAGAHLVDYEIVVGV